MHAPAYHMMVPIIIIGKIVHNQYCPDYRIQFQYLNFHGLSHFQSKVIVFVGARHL